MSNVFLLSWDMLGLGSCINVSDISGHEMWAVLKNERPPSLRAIVNGVLLRARYNSQRHYEVYSVEMDGEIGENDVREMFEANPQGMADLVRERGTCIYSDRIIPTEVKIT